MREAGVPFMAGSDSGFAVTPYGEWHAREIEILVDWIGFTPAQALRIATSGTAKAMPRGQLLGAIETGRHADFLFVDGDPLVDVRILQKRGAIDAVYVGGGPVSIAQRPYDAYKVTHFNSIKWTDVYTRERVNELRQAT
jgi:imidazolonepropionase-like amidohydrolase